MNKTIIDQYTYSGWHKIVNDVTHPNAAQLLDRIEQRQDGLLMKVDPLVIHETIIVAAVAGGFYRQAQILLDRDPSLSEHVREQLINAGFNIGPISGIHHPTGTAMLSVMLAWIIQTLVL